jgi:hypothetical protein
MVKRILGVAVGLLVALLAGVIWGASGKSDVRRALQAAELRDDLHEARAAVLDGRLDLYSVNFGEASRHFGAARTALAAAADRLEHVDREEDARRLAIAATSIEEAQRLSGQLNQDANSRAADAAKAIGDVLDPTVKR